MGAGQGEAFGLNRSEYKTLRGYPGDAVTFPRILGIELVGVGEAVHGDAPAVPPETTVAALMGEMGRAFAMSSVGLACFELARAAGVRVTATTRSQSKGRRLAELGAAGTGAS